jgi:hypothetical protein
MSTLGNDLIERLRTRLLGVQPENQLREGAIVLGEGFEYQRECENGGIGRADCPLRLLCRQDGQSAIDGDSFCSGTNLGGREGKRGSRRNCGDWTGADSEISLSCFPADNFSIIAAQNPKVTIGLIGGPLQAAERHMNRTNAEGYNTLNSNEL